MRRDNARCWWVPLVSNCATIKRFGDGCQLLHGIGSPESQFMQIAAVPGGLRWISESMIHERRDRIAGFVHTRPANTVATARFEGDHRNGARGDTLQSEQIRRNPGSIRISIGRLPLISFVGLTPAASTRRMPSGECTSNSPSRSASAGIATPVSKVKAGAHDNIPGLVDAGQC